ncbi:MAG: penicillin-binding protein activator [Magnetococcales bacterium]|nr:penicillin-binding protein activator [Magnetococcales bacterium]
MRTYNCVCPQLRMPAASSLSVLARGLFWFLVLASLLAGGCTTTAVEKKGDPVASKIQDTPVPKARIVDKSLKPEDMIAEARGLVEKNRLEAAITLYQRIIDDFGQTPQANEARYRLGNHLLLQGQSDQAWTLFSEAGSRPDHPFSWESLILAGDIQAQRGDWAGAWTQWIKVAWSPASQKQGATAWQRLIKSYAQYGNAENTQRLFQILPPGQLSQDQARITLATIDQIDTERLKQLHALQPPNSALAPLFALILGDRQYQEGGTGAQGAKDYWQSARASDVTSQEAQRRLTPGENKQGLIVGLLLPLSGEHENLGKNLLKAAKKALRDYPDTKIILKVSDSHGKADEAKRAMEQFHTEGVGAVIGPVFHDEAKAAAEVAVRYNMPTITLNPRADVSRPGTNVFQNAFIPENEGQFMARVAIEEKKLHRFVVLAPESEYGHLLTQAFSDAVQKLGGTIVRVTFFPPGTNDFSPWIKALINADPKDPNSAPPSGKNSGAMASVDFDGLFLPANAQEVRLILPQTAFFKLRQPSVTFLGTSLWNKSELFKEGADSLQGAYFCDIDETARNRFNTSFQQAWKESPSTLDMLAYDSIALIAQALRVERMSGQPWTQALKGGQRIYGAAGVVYFDEAGQSRRNYSLYRIEGNGPKRLDPPAWQDQTVPGIAADDKGPMAPAPTNRGMVNSVGQTPGDDGGNTLPNAGQIRPTYF